MTGPILYLFIACCNGAFQHKKMAYGFQVDMGFR
ncbi:MAG: hypothetical protein ACJAU1_000863 [Psychromonas sp.]|jgi:hypothetical protein